LLDQWVHGYPRGPNTGSEGNAGDLAVGVYLDAVPLNRLHLAVQDQLDATPAHHFPCHSFYLTETEKKKTVGEDIYLKILAFY
jgi:hypothetical protein